MASIDSISLPSSVSYFDPQVYDTATKKEYNREFNPLAALKPDQPIEFFVRGADSLYVDLSNSMIAIGVKVNFHCSERFHYHKTTLKSRSAMMMIALLPVMHPLDPLIMYFIHYSLKPILNSTGKA